MFDSLAATASRSSGGVLIYAVKADDFHRPRVCMKESLNPARAAVEAAPILKL